MSRAEQFSSAEDVIGVNFWPCQTATSAAASVAKTFRVRGHGGDGVVHEFQDVIDEGNVSNTAAAITHNPENM